MKCLNLSRSSWFEVFEIKPCHQLQRLLMDYSCFNPRDAINYTLKSVSFVYFKSFVGR